MSDYSVRMIFIDDKSVTTNLDKAGYRKMGVHVTSVTSFKDAEKKLNPSIDVIVINMDYAGVDACGTAQHFTNSSKWSDVPIVMTSVQGSAANRKKALASGAKLFVEQPVPRNYFIEKIKELIDQETRNTKRVEALGTVTFSVGDIKDTVTIGDLSMSGMLLATDFDIEDGEQLELEIKLNDQTTPLKVEGEVVRTIKFSNKHPNRQTGIGVRFTKFKESSKAKLEKYVEITAHDDPQLRYYL